MTFYSPADLVAMRFCDNIKQAQKCCREGQIPAVKSGKRWRIPVDAFEKYIEESIQHRVEITEKGGCYGTE